MAIYINSSYCNVWLIPCLDCVPLTTIQKKNKALIAVSFIGQSEKDQEILDKLQISNKIVMDAKLIAKCREDARLVFIFDRIKVVATCTNRSEVKEGLVKKKIYSEGFICGQFQDVCSLIFYKTVATYSACTFVKEFFELAKDQAVSPEKEVEVDVGFQDGCSLIEQEERLEKEAQVKWEFFRLSRDGK